MMKNFNPTVCYSVYMTSRKTSKKAPQLSQADISGMRHANIVNTGADFITRTIFLTDAIDDEVVFNAISAIRIMDQASADPIEIIVNSPGGNEASGTALYDFIRMCRCPIMTSCIGQASSIAALIFQAGDVRRMTEGAVTLIHDGSIMVSGLDTAKFVAIGKNLKDNNDRYYAALAYRTRNSIDQVQKWCSEEKTFNSQDAMRHGFCDIVWKSPYSEDRNLAYLQPGPIQNAPSEEDERAMAELNRMIQEGLDGETPKKVKRNKPLPKAKKAKKNKKGKK